ncbi:3-methyl-2-oxobutanoate hydroxymethyltransferase [Mesorhizobium sp. PL10]
MATNAENREGNVKKRPSVYDLLQLKGKRQLLELHVDDECEGAAAEAAGIDIFSCEVNAKLPLIREAAPATFIQAAIPHGSISGPETGVRKGFEVLALGADAVYCTASPKVIEAMANEGIPVTSHVGLVPNWSTWTNYRAIGKTPIEAMQVYRKMKTLESAGAWAVEVEVVPVKIAAFLTANTSMLTEGMGSGSVCDTQYLFSSDVLGTNTGHYPRHAKRYADLASELERLQEMRVRAIAAFVADVKNGTYPEPKHGVDVNEDVFEEFLTLIGSPRAS